jgi:hypothetical protein
MRECVARYQQTTAVNVTIQTIQKYDLNVDVILHKMVCSRAMVLGGSWYSAMVMMGPVQVVVYRCGAPDFGVRHPNCEKYPSPCGAFSGRAAPLL